MLDYWNGEARDKYARVMPRVFNLYGDVEWDRTEDRPGWRSKDAWVGHHIGGELIGGSMYELEAGDRLWRTTPTTQMRSGCSSRAARRRFVRPRARPIYEKGTSSRSRVGMRACTRSVTGPTRRSVS
jgi:hypothetical protein